MICLTIKVYNNVVKESCAEVVCPYCDTKHFIVKGYNDSACRNCTKQLTEAQLCISEQEKGRFKYHKKGWPANDAHMLRRFNGIYEN